MATATTHLTAAGAGLNISAIIDCCNNFLKHDKFDECVNIIKNELSNYISKLIKFLDDTKDLLAKRKMYLLKSYYGSIETLADKGPANRNSLEEHLTSLSEHAKDAENLLGFTN